MATIGFGPVGSVTNGGYFGGSISPSGVAQGFEGAVSDLFAASADRSKAQFDQAEQTEYQLAGTYAGQEEQYTARSTAIKTAQQSRTITQSLGRTTAQVAGAGFTSSGTAMDLMRSNAQQGSIALSAMGQQGLVSEQGYTEQQESMETMAAAAGQAASAENTAATGADIGAAISVVTGLMPH